MHERFLSSILGGTILMLGLLHVGLPSLFGWEVVLTHEPMLAWGLLMLNFATSWQFVVIGASVLLRNRQYVQTDLVWYAWIVFWLGMCIYLAVRPMPVSSVFGTLAPIGFSLFQASGATVMLMSKRYPTNPRLEA